MRWKQDINPDLPDAKIYVLNGHIYLKKTAFLGQLAPLGSPMS